MRGISFCCIDFDQDIFHHKVVGTDADYDFV